jgi:predicted ATPase
VPLLTRLHLEGFRSIKTADVELRALNVMIGANGAGKSNLIDFFRMLNFALTRGFQDPYQKDRGPASAILHFGSKVTGVIRGELIFETESGRNFYRFTLADSAGDRLTFTKEEVQFHATAHEQPMPPVSLISHPSNDSGLTELWAENDSVAEFTKRFLQRCRVYQFHDTGLKSHLRDYSPVDQSAYLYADAGNLSAVLFDLRTYFPDDYSSIVRNLRSILPWFDDFELEPDGNRGVLLRWRMTGRGDYLFGPGQLSDGSLRIMALVTLLLQPVNKLPAVIILDEPELGLHPAAEQVIAGLIHYASRHCQVLVSTQSATFIDHFSPDDILVVENENGESSFTRQSTETLGKWLERYTLSQIWSKNIIGGRP